jgi:hypothetical protein
MGDRMTEMGPPTRLVGDNVEHWMTFALFAQGYPMAQGAFCSEHLGLAIIDDASHPGGTDAWTIRLSKTPCRTCSQAASGSSKQDCESEDDILRKAADGWEILEHHAQEQGWDE